MRVLLGELPAHIDSTTCNLVDIINGNVILLTTISECINSNMQYNADILDMIEFSHKITKITFKLLSSVINSCISNTVNNDQVASSVVENSLKVISLICKSYNCPECDPALLVASKEQYMKRCASSVCLLCHGGIPLYILTFSLSIMVYI